MDYHEFPDFFTTNALRHIGAQISLYLFIPLCEKINTQNSKNQKLQKPGIPSFYSVKGCLFHKFQIYLAERKTLNIKHQTTNNITLCAFAPLRLLKDVLFIALTLKGRNSKTIISFLHLCTLVPLWLSSFSTTQAQITKDTIQLKTVEIKAKIPIEQKALSHSRVDTIELQKLQTKSLAELIQSTGPVFVKTYGRGSSATVSFRGTASSHTQVNWNGMNINSPMRGDVDISLIPVYFIDDVSLLHGGSSLSQTSGGLGGSIQLNNQADWSNRLQLKYLWEVESFNTFKEFVQIGLGNKNFQSSTRFFHEQSENNFPFYNYGVLPQKEEVQKNADYKKYGFLQEFYFREEKHQLSAKIWGGHQFRNLPQLMSYEGNNRKEYQEDDEWRGILQWEYLNNYIKWEAFSSFKHHQLHYYRSSTELEFENFNSLSNENSSLNRLLFQYKKKELFNFKTYIDFNYHLVKVEDRAIQSSFEKDRLEIFWVGQVNWALSERASAFAILRSEFYDQMFIPLIPAMGFEYQISSGISAFINASRNYHKPTLNDLYWVPGGNPDLKPEDAWSADLGFKTQLTHENLSFHFQLNTYQSLIDNWIIWQPSSSGAFYWEAVNLKKVWARGIESQLKINWDFRKNWKLYFSANYTYTRTTNQNALSSVDESRGKQLIYIPVHSANFLFNLQFKNLQWSLGNQSIGKRYTNSSNVENDFELILSPFSVMNSELAWQKQFKNYSTRLAFRVENLFDTDYMMILWRPMPGRYYAFNLQIKWRK